MMASTSPLETFAPMSNGSARTVPATGDGREFCIFMASSTTTGCPDSTVHADFHFVSENQAGHRRLDGRLAGVDGGGVYGDRSGCGGRGRTSSHACGGRRSRGDWIDLHEERFAVDIDVKGAGAVALWGGLRYLRGWREPDARRLRKEAQASSHRASGRGRA